MKRPLVLCIMDGFGLRDEEFGNAIKAASTPNLDRLFNMYPFTTLGASGMSVGLPDGQMGNSEVGHTNMGAGRIVYQELTRITKEIEDGPFFENPALVTAIERAVDSSKAVHIMGLMSDGGVHSHMEHCFALIDMCGRMGAEKVFVHAFMDGRDVSPTSGAGYLKQLSDKLAQAGTGHIGVVSGRFYRMDRDNRWERISKAYDALVSGDAPLFPDPVSKMESNYENGETDEFTVPFIVTEGSAISDGDSVIFFNFRPDRAREITRALVDRSFDGFSRTKKPEDLYYVCFTQYDATIEGVDIAFRPQSLDNTLGRFIADRGRRQLRIAETEKYAHVTFFFNGGVEEPNDGEDRSLIPSPKVATYDLKPEMSAYEVTDELFRRIDTGRYDVIILNYANCDMVGHTGVFEAAVKAVETVDECVGKLRERILKENGVLLITADHGNADYMINEDGSPFTAHTTNPVPFCVVNYPCKLRKGGVLADIAPTMIQIMGERQPAEMTGKSLITIACDNC